jgi:cell division septation protein DedD
MVSILDLQDRIAAPDNRAPSRIAEERIETVEPVVEKAEPPQEFEFVLGRRQIASLLFVSTVILMICVAIAYLAGKSIGAKAPVAEPTIAAATSAPPVLARETEPPPIILNQEPAPEPPVFAEPKNGSVYIQMGAVEKGVAVIFAEGLRKHGLTSFVAPGPSEKIFRVLIGPLPDPASYVKAKDVVDKIGLSTFARRFPN